MKTAAALVLISALSAQAFAPAHHRPAAVSTSLFSTSAKSQEEDLELTRKVIAEVQPAEAVTEVIQPAAAAAPAEVTPPTAHTPAPKKAAAPKKPAAKKGGPQHKEGVFSPVVLFVKELMGDKELNKLRGKVISVHSGVIGKFVDTSESAFGDAVLRALFRLADKDGSGEVDKEELKAAVETLGFTWLKEKQIEGLFARADADGSGTIDMEEWVEAAPKTLRTNLIKLAKKNGNDMGLLA